MNNSVFGKTMGNLRKIWGIKLITTEKRRNHLVSEPNYHAAKFFLKNLLVTEIKKTLIFMNKSFYLGLSTLEISKIVTYEFWYDYVKL